jgi:hypothetical protein
MNPLITKSLRDQSVSSRKKLPFLKRTRHILDKSVLIIALLLNGFMAKSQNTIYSPEFNAFIKQLQTVYCQPNGLNYQELRKSEPVVYATLVGHGLRQQLISAQKNAVLKAGYDLLQQEAMRYIFESVQTFKYKSANGQPIKEESLWLLVQDGIKGLKDDKVLKDFHVRQGSAPSILLEKPTPRKGEGQSLGKAYIEKKKENAITLLNIEAPRVEGGGSGFVINEEYNKLGFKWDDIVGTWQDFWKGSDTSKAYFKGKPPYCTLRITKEKAGDGFFYLGKVINKSPGFDYFFRCTGDGTMFKVNREDPLTYYFIVGRYNGFGFGDIYGTYNDKAPAEWTEYYSIFMNPNKQCGWLLTVLGNFASESSNTYLFRKTGN